MKELLRKYGEPWCYNHQYDFGLESAEKVADFHNNGGLELTNEVCHFAIQYVALKWDGIIEIGAWVWWDGEDFDQDATFEVYEEDDFSAEECELIMNKIREIYE